MTTIDQFHVREKAEFKFFLYYYWSEGLDPMSGVLGPVTITRDPFETANEL
jgi:hypothetical protein